MEPLDRKDVHLAPRGGSVPRADVIVIGAGIAGLMAAATLSSLGRRVRVVELDHQAGGLMAGIRRQGFSFDVGCQSFEDMGMVFPLLDEVGLGDLGRFRRARYRVVMPGLDTVVDSLPQTRAAFQAAYPACAEGLGRVFEQHERTAELIRRLFAPGVVPLVRAQGPSSVLRWLARALDLPLPRPSRVRELLALLLEDSGAWYERQLPPSPVRDLLARCGYTRMNLFVASAFWHLWADDYWYPEGGFQRLFERCVERLEDRGVHFSFKREVVRLEVERKRVVAVHTHRGERLEADQVVYAGDYRQLVHRLLGTERFGTAAVRRLERARHSDALVSVYLGLDVDPAQLRERLQTDHVFYFPHADCRTAIDPADPEAHRRAFLEVTAHSIGDPSLAPPGKSSVVLQAFTRHDWQRGWETGLSGDPGLGIPFAPRSPAYRTLKRRVASELVQLFEGLVPGVGSRILFADVGAPPSTVRFTRNAYGGSCGFELNWRNFPFVRPLGQARSPLDNLHLAGHFTVWPGTVPTAALSGRIAALRAHERLPRSRRWPPRRAAPGPPGGPGDGDRPPGPGESTAERRP